jgi:hypothetical protein
MTLRPEPYRTIEQRAAAGTIDAIRAEATRCELSLLLLVLGLSWVLSDPTINAAIVGPRSPNTSPPPSTRSTTHSPRPIAPIAEQPSTGNH